MMRGMKREKISAGISANRPEYSGNSEKSYTPRPFIMNREVAQLIVAWCRSLALISISAFGKDLTISINLRAGRQIDPCSRTTASHSVVIDRSRSVARIVILPWPVSISRCERIGMICFVAATPCRQQSSLRNRLRSTLMFIASYQRLVHEAAQRSRYGAETREKLHPRLSSCGLVAKSYRFESSCG